MLGVVLPHLERLPSEIAGLAAGCPRLFGPAVSDEPRAADRRPGKRRPVVPIDRDRLFEQAERLENPLSRYWIEGRERAQVEIVGGQILRRTFGRAAHLGGL
jgi:hypothetical protein